MEFRKLMLQDSKWRIVDMVGHIVMSIMLPGSWWMQFIPDVFVPVLMLKSLKSNKLLPDKHWAVIGNVAMHSIIGSMSICVIVFVCTDDIRFASFMWLQWLLHIAWDSFTHVQDWNRKPILW
jgi:hypothetical protein